MATDNSGSTLSDSNRIFNDSEEMVDLLVSLGADINTAKTLMCLHVHGPSKSSELQSKCDLRQPDVSISINKLKKMEVIRIISSASKGRGRPSHIYELAMPLNEALVPFRRQAKERLSILQNQLSRLTELANSASD
jgi:predicted transcriptional regulator